MLFFGIAPLSACPLAGSPALDPTLHPLSTTNPPNSQTTHHPRRPKPAIANLFPAVHPSRSATRTAGPSVESSAKNSKA
jgi:hypothetical protein